MKLGVFAKIFDGATPRAVLRSARRAGYECVQYSMTCSGLSALPLHIDESVAEAVGSAASETGVSIEAVSATYNMIHPDAGERERGRAGFRAIAAAAHTMGTRLLTVCTGTCDPHDQWRYHPSNCGTAAWDEMCREFGLLLRIAEEQDIFIGVEPELANVVSSAKHARRLLDAFGDSRIRIVLDAANLFDVASSDKQRSIIEEAVALLGDAIMVAHAKDRLADGHFAAAGTGVLDYDHYLTVLRNSGFRNSIIAHGMTPGEAAAVAGFLKARIAAASSATHATAVRPQLW